MISSDRGPSRAHLEYFVDGMDCASCVQNVERMIERLPGADGVKTSFNRQTLELDLDESRTPRTRLEENLRALGYTPSPLGPVAAPTLPAPAHLEYFVDGMDCASCVQKVERMVAGLPGTGAVKTSFNKQTLALSLDEAQTPRATLEGNLQALGYTPSLLGGAPTPAPAHDHHDHAGHEHGDHDHAGHGHVHEAPKPGQPWYATGQGKLVVTSGVLLALAWLFGFVEPQFATWGFIAATLLGVWPLAKKAVASARFGDPFSISTLR